MKIGIIGLGLMGKQIAKKLIETGHDVTVWNRTAEAMDEMVAAGAKRAANVGDALQGDMLLSILFDDEAVRSVLMTKEALDGAKFGGVHVCMSTVTVAFGRELEAYHYERSLSYVAAPMLGRPDVIHKSSLNILAAGDAGLLDRIEVPLGCLGKFWRVGSDPVHGQVAKLAANFMISGALETMAEAVAMMDVHGADSEHFISIMTDTLFGAFVYKAYGPMIAGKTPEVPSGLSLPMKDNLSFLQAAEGKGIKIPLAEVVRINLAIALEAGGAKDDWSTALATVARGLK